MSIDLSTEVPQRGTKAEASAELEAFYADGKMGNQVSMLRALVSAFRQSTCVQSESHN
jgi:hypothetical protein